MTFQDFITKYNGKGIDFDGAYGYQCMDLMHQYVVEVLGQSNPAILAAPTAAQVYSNFANITGHELFDKIDNTPTGVPANGDIMFWKPNVSGVTGSAGHVAIYINGDVNGFNSFDQNYPTGTLCHTQGHNYNGVYGWLRFKPQDTLDSLRKQRDDNWNLYQTELSKNSNLTIQLNNANQQVLDLQNKIAKAKADLN